jgi:microcystin-dependent protein
MAIGQYIGSISMMGFNFAPTGWALCNGQTLSISQNTALFSLIGTTYGGNGVSTFQLPNLQSSVPIHQGTGAGLSTYVIGQVGGAENVTLNTNQIPAHSHSFNGSATAGAQSSPSGATLAESNTGTPHTPNLNVPNFVTSAPNANMAGSTISNAGGNVPHTNIQPYLVISFVIALVGIFPSRN